MLKNQILWTLQLPLSLFGIGKEFTYAKKPNIVDTTITFRYM